MEKKPLFPSRHEALVHSQRGGIRAEEVTEIQTLYSEYLATTRRVAERPGSEDYPISKAEEAKAAGIIRRVKQILRMD